jgi:hypothetical protein
VALALAASIAVAPGVARAGSDPFEVFKVDCNYQVVLERAERPLLDVERACQRRLRDLPRRYDRALGLDDEAYYAYRLNVVEGVDRGAISPIRANFLLSEYRRALAAEQESADAARRAE